MEIGRAMKHIDLAFRRNGDRMLEQYGLTISQLNLLIFLFRSADEGKQVIQRDIEQALNLSNPTISGTLDRLEKNGFICRTQNPENRRVNRIELTEKALNMKQESRAKIKEFTRQVLSPLTEEEQKQLEIMLNKILMNLPQ